MNISHYKSSFKSDAHSSTQENNHTFIQFIRLGSLIESGFKSSLCFRTLFLKLLCRKILNTYSNTFKQLQEYFPYFISMKLCIVVTINAYLTRNFKWVFSEKENEKKLFILLRVKVKVLSSKAVFKFNNFF